VKVLVTKLQEGNTKREYRKIERKHEERNKEMGSKHIENV